MKNVDSNCRIATAGRRECEEDSKRVNAARTHIHTHTEASRYTSTHSVSYSGLYYCARRFAFVVVFIVVADFDEKYDYVPYANALQ